MCGIVGGMDKTTVYLTSDQKRALAEVAESQGRSEARLIRDGIDEVIRRHGSGETAAPYGAAPLSATTLAVRPTWIGRDEFVRRFAHVQADPMLAAELRGLAPDTTDDLGEESTDGVTEARRETAP